MKLLYSGLRKSAVTFVIFKSTNLPLVKVGAAGSGGRIIQILYLSKRINTAMYKYSIISKSPA